MEGKDSQESSSTAPSLPAPTVPADTDHDAGSECSTAASPRQAEPVPKPASRWGQPAGGADSVVGEGPKRPTLAEMLRQGRTEDPQLPTRGCRLPVAQPHARHGPPQSRRANKDDEEGPELWDPARGAHGWRKQDKASWNTKLQRKVSEQASRRAEQSQQSRCRFVGFAED